MIDLAYAMGAPPQAGNGPASLLISMAPIALVLAVFFFLVIRPQQREKGRREEMLGALKKGDRVVTTGGLVGTIVGLSTDTLTLKIADSVRVECLRSAGAGLRQNGRAEQDSA